MVRRQEGVYSRRRPTSSKASSQGHFTQCGPVSCSPECRRRFGRCPSGACLILSDLLQRDVFGPAQVGCMCVTGATLSQSQVSLSDVVQGLIRGRTPVTAHDSHPHQNGVRPCTHGSPHVPEVAGHRGATKGVTGAADQTFDRGLTVIQVEFLPPTAPRRVGNVLASIWMRTHGQGSFQACIRCHACRTLDIVARLWSVTFRLWSFRGLAHENTARSVLAFKQSSSKGSKERRRASAKASADHPDLDEVLQIWRVDDTRCLL